MLDLQQILEVTKQKGAFMDNYIDTLIKVPLFANIEKDSIPVMLKRLKAHHREYAKNEYVKLSGDPADFIGIVLEGEIQILRDDYYGNRSITASFQKGAMFAEAFACAGVRRLPVDIMCSTKSTLMFLDSNHIFNACEGKCEFHHILIQNLLHIVASKNILLTQKLRYTSHKTTAEKLMAYFMDQSQYHNSPEFTIPFNRQQLADYLGVDRSAMCTEISKLQKEGYIETNRSRFKLLNPLQL